MILVPEGLRLDSWLTQLTEEYHIIVTLKLDFGTTC
jgi:hypothetical protein